MEATLSNGIKPGALRPLGELVSLTRVHKAYGDGFSGVHALHDALA